MSFLEVVEITNEICSLAGVSSSPSSTGYTETSSGSSSVGIITFTTSSTSTVIVTATQTPNGGNKMEFDSDIIMACLVGIVAIAL